MSAHVQLHQAGVLTGRQMVMVVTIGLHALAITALMAIRTVLDPATPDRRMTLELETKPVQVEPEPQGIDDTGMMRVALAQPDVRNLPRVEPVFGEEETVPPGPTAPDVLPAPPQQFGGGEGLRIAPTALQFRAVRPSDDYYPSESMTLGEEGIAIVRVCVAPSGRVDGKPVIDKSSGSPRLDRAAVAWAREALRFTPATENGVAVAACKGFRVNFTLH